MKSKRQHSETFADIVNEVDKTPPSAFEVWTSPISDSEWYDAIGNRWHMRGRLLDIKQMRRLLKRSDLRVVHFYAAPSEVSGSAARDELVARIEEFFKGDAPPYKEFRLADFRDDHAGVMLVVEEFC